MSTTTWDVPERLERATNRPVARHRTAVPQTPRALLTVRTKAAGPSAEASGLRLTRRGRIAVVLASAAVAVAAALTAQSATADAPRDALPVQAHTVGQGETLWQIAGQVAEPGQDVRDVVAELIDLNGLGSGALQAGQEILLPAEQG